MAPVKYSIQGYAAGVLEYQHRLLSWRVSAVNTQILRLRRKLESDPAKPRYICNELGAGYAFSARVDIIY